MFKCKDCSATYPQKPTYCNCGNNEFDEIASGQAINEESVSQANMNFIDKNSRIKRILSSMDVLSTSIFILCIILSIVSWIFIGKDSLKNKQHKKPLTQEQKQVTRAIPNLNSFWDNTPPKGEYPSQKRMPVPLLQEQIQPEPVIEPPPVYQPPITPAPKITPPQPIARPVKIPNPKTVVPSASMSRYKVALRQTLFSHLSVSSIQGAGKCEIEFSISDTGKLLNRKFSKLSDNKSLNDAVYNMLMSVPQYLPPPSDYNGEKIRLNFSFDNGYYEVSY